MIFGTFILSGIFGASAFLQADARGWKFFLAPFLLLAMAIGLHFYIMNTTGMSAGRNSPAYTVIGATMAGGTVMLGGLAFGAVAVRWLNPGRAGTIAFALCLTALWLLSFTLA